LFFYMSLEKEKGSISSLSYLQLLILFSFKWNVADLNIDR